MRLNDVLQPFVNQGFILKLCLVLFFGVCIPFGAYGYKDTILQTRAVPTFPGDPFTKFTVNSADLVINTPYIPISVIMTQKDQADLDTSGLTFILHRISTGTLYLLEAGVSTLVTAPSLPLPLVPGLPSANDYTILIQAFSNSKNVTVTFSTQVFTLNVPGKGNLLDVYPYFYSENILRTNSTTPPTAYLVNPHLGLPAIKLNIAQNGSLGLDNFDLRKFFLPQSRTYKLIVSSADGYGIFASPNLLGSTNSLQVARWKSFPYSQISMTLNSVKINTPSNFSRALTVLQNDGSLFSPNVNGNELSFSRTSLPSYGPSIFLTVGNDGNLYLWGPFQVHPPSVSAPTEYIPEKVTCWPGNTAVTVTSYTVTTTDSHSNSITTTTTTTSSKSSTSSTSTRVPTNPLASYGEKTVASGNVLAATVVLLMLSLIHLI